MYSIKVAIYITLHSAVHTGAMHSCSMYNIIIHIERNARDAFSCEHVLFKLQ